MSGCARSSTRRGRGRRTATTSRASRHVAARVAPTMRTAPPSRRPRRPLRPSGSPPPASVRARSSCGRGRRRRACPRHSSHLCRRDPCAGRDATHGRARHAHGAGSPGCSPSRRADGRGRRRGRRSASTARHAQRTGRPSSRAPRHSRTQCSASTPRQPTAGSAHAHTSRLSNAHAGTPDVARAPGALRVPARRGPGALLASRLARRRGCLDGRCA